MTCLNYAYLKKKYVDDFFHFYRPLNFLFILTICRLFIKHFTKHFTTLYIGKLTQIVSVT